MVCNQPDGHIIYGVGLILFMGHLTDFIPNGFHGVNIKNGIHILHHHRKTLKSHSRVNIFLVQLFVSTFSVPVKLGEYVVPHFHKTVAVTSHLTVRAAASVFFPSVIIDFRTGAAGAGAVLPEIVTCPGFWVAVKPGNLFRRNANVLVPDFKGLLILPVNGRVQPVRRKP